VCFSSNTLFEKSLSRHSTIVSSIVITEPGMYTDENIWLSVNPKAVSTWTAYLGLDASHHCSKNVKTWGEPFKFISEHGISSDLGDPYNWLLLQ
jgi:hypothetical protein